MYKSGISYIRAWFVCMVICTIIASMIFLFSLLNHAYISIPRQVLFYHFVTVLSENFWLQSLKKCSAQMSHRSVRKFIFIYFVQVFLGNRLSVIISDVPSRLKHDFENIRVVVYFEFFRNIYQRMLSSLNVSNSISKSKFHCDQCFFA